MSRWTATATYRTGSGPLDVTHDIEELRDIHGLIEAGPDWNALTDIRITLARPMAADLTLEECERAGQMSGDELEAWLAGRAKT